MTLTSHCNYAGPLGKLIPTRSRAWSLFARLRVPAIARLRE
jgi:hypothetical protein